MEQFAGCVPAAARANLLAFVQTRLAALQSGASAAEGGGSVAKVERKRILRQIITCHQVLRFLGDWEGLTAEETLAVSYSFSC